VTVSLRYALYYAPAPGSAWASFGEDWLARLDARLDHPRRYNFHATLKAPFRLAPGVSLADLAEEVDRFARSHAPFCVPVLRVERLDDFLAVVPENAEPRLDALAADCVRRFDCYRAPLNALELARRRSEPLTQRQAALLDRWGYPHVLEEFRFHLSLTGPLNGASAPEVPPLPREPLHIDAITVFEDPGAPARLRPVHRARFGRRGRLVYVVGASGSGKDALIAWVRQRDPPGVAFAQRRITRAVQATGEQHIPLGEAEFDAQLLRGDFAMHWRANGHRYAVGREIDEWLARDLTVLVNGSREHLPRAREAYPQLEAVHVSAPGDVLRARLAARAREDGGAIEARLARRPTVPNAALEISNGGAIDAAGERLLRLLTADR
jgi:phosphonate metabolism protein PhnN/1,5-bisphosphokinase (PRPP-forming)